MDDSDDKVRRNLVVFSALVLAAAWLEHPELWLLSSLMVDSAAPPPAWKVTVLALCVQAYLIARYWFSAAHEVGRNVMGKDWDRILNRLRTQMITDAFEKYHLTKKQPAFIVDDLKEAVRKDLAEWSSTPDQSQLEFISIAITLQNSWEGRVVADRRISGDKRTGQKSGGNYFHLKIPSGIKMKLKLRVLFRQIIFTQTTVEYLVPIVLAAAASSVLVQKLIRAML